MLSRLPLGIAAFSLAAAAVFPTPLSAQDPSPFDHPDGTTHWYLCVAVPGGIDWDAASREAARAGGYLATVTSAAEAGVVFSLADRPTFWQAAPGGVGRDGPWLGAFQAPGAAGPDRGWDWNRPLDDFSFLNWAPNHPDGGAADDRLHLHGTAGRADTWSDAPASRMLPGYVVEFSDFTVPGTLGLVQDRPGSHDGYVLFNPLRSTRTFLVDGRGRAVHEWTSNYTPGAAAYLLPNGNLIRCGNDPNTPIAWAGGRGGIVEEFDWDGNLLWTYSLSTPDQVLHHDLEVLPNGNVLMLVWDRRSGPDAVANGRDPNTLPEGDLWQCKIIEVQPTRPSGGTVVWEWQPWDHLIQDFDPAQANFGNVSSRPERIDINYGSFGITPIADWMHTNSIDYEPSLDQIALSVRHFNELWVIDHSTTTAEAAGSTGGRSGRGGDLLYRWGNPEAYGLGGPNDRQFFNQHDVQWIEPGLPGAGNLLVFDNGYLRPAPAFSEVEELVPPTPDPVTGNYARAPGAPWGPSAPVWSWRASPAESFYSTFTSGATRLPNGHTMVAGGWIGRFLEVDRAGNVVWEYVNPVENDRAAVQGDVPAGSLPSAVFRAPYYPASFPAFAGRNLDADAPVEAVRAALLAEGSRLPVDVAPGGTVGFDLVFEAAPRGFYQVATSATPGLTPYDFRFVRQAADPLFVATFSGTLAGPFFENYRGVLDASGRATARLVLPALPGLVGVELYTSFVVVDPFVRGGIASISNAVTTRVR